MRSCLHFVGLTGGIALLLACDSISTPTVSSESDQQSTQQQAAGSKEAAQQNGSSATAEVKLSNYDYFEQDFGEETEYILETTIRDLIEMMSYGAEGKVPEGLVVAAYWTPQNEWSKPDYDINIQFDGKKDFISKPDHNQMIWSKECLADVISNLENVYTVKASSGIDNDQGALAKRLLDMSGPAIAKESVTLSKALQEDFNNPFLHEQAAFLIGALSSLDCSRQMTELRSLICRQTAHEIYADMLRDGKEMSVYGKLAKAMKLGVLNLQTDAMATLEQVPTSDPALESWVVAIKAYITTDYRPFDRQDARNSLEAIMEARARSITIGNLQAYTELGPDADFTMAEANRVVGFWDTSVGVGRVLLETWSQAELKDASTVYTTMTGQEWDDDRTVELLNAQPGRLLSNSDHLQVIDWGQWAHFYQRHLCQSFIRSFETLDETWGVPEYAADYRDYLHEKFSGLRLFPFVAWNMVPDRPSYLKVVDTMFENIKKDPHLIPLACWRYCSYNSPVDGDRYIPTQFNGGNPMANEWAFHNPPWGTIYDIYSRTFFPSFTMKTDFPDIAEEYTSKAPWHYHLPTRLKSMEETKMSESERIDRYFGKTLEFNAGHLFRAGQAKEGDERFQFYSRAAAINPAYYVTLMNEYLSKGLIDEAVESAELALEKYQDEVGISNSLGWLIRYYHEENRKEDARRLADRVAATGAQSGLQDKMTYLILVGDRDGAMEMAEAIKDRYNSGFPMRSLLLTDYFLTGSGKVKLQLMDLKDSTFPNGVQFANLNSFRGVPTAGTLIEESSDIAEYYGLQKNDVIVALNGIKTDNDEQYLQVNGQIPGEELNLIVYRPQSSEYLEINASPPNKKFGIPLGVWQ